MQKVIIFSGAGMSAESGIATFRDSGGLWENYNIEEVATPHAWNTNPEKVQHFYNLRRKNIREASPNEAHISIAQMESNFDVTVITQNIDDLHERAGSSDVLHLHGNIMLAKSSGPNQEKRYYPIEGDLDLKKDFCEDGYPLRPHVVWFGEDVPNYEKALSIIQEASVFIVIGTSLNVYPAAGLIHYAPPGCKCFVVDPNVDELSVPKHFSVIKTGAVEGMKKIELLLLQTQQTIK
jgi:NAD-dependent deacetylase